MHGDFLRRCPEKKTSEAASSVAPAVLSRAAASVSVSKMLGRCFCMLSSGITNEQLRALREEQGKDDRDNHSPVLRNEFELGDYDENFLARTIWNSDMIEVSLQHQVSQIRLSFHIVAPF